MYFKVNKVFQDKYQKMGMVNISASFYLEPEDEGYDKYVAEHYVDNKVIPKGGYLGKVNENDEPLDLNDYQDWYDSLPSEKVLNPFCTHFIQFEPNVTEEEILWCFEWALAITHKNYLKDDLKCKKGGQTVNQDIKYKSRKAYYTALTFIPNRNKSTKEQEDYKKVKNAEDKILELEKIKDWSSVKTTAKYKVK